MSIKADPLFLFSSANPDERLVWAEEKFGIDWLARHELEGELFHYTDVNGLMGILRERQLRLSHISTLNDPAEMAYGRDLIREILNERIDQESEASRKFLAQLDADFRGYSGRVHDPFLISFCEKGNLLSQWRAYADQGRGYSLGFTFSPETRISATINLPFPIKPYFRKVIYRPGDQKKLVQQWLDAALDAVTAKPRSANEISMLVLQAVNPLLDMMLCFKSEVFEEENEWRLVRVTRDNHESHLIDFRSSFGQLVPFRPMYVFDEPPTGTISACMKLRFPLTSVRFGPAIASDRATPAIEMFLSHLEEDQKPIQLKKSGVKIIPPGFGYR